MTTLLVLIYLAFIGLGLPDSLLGTAWPVAHLDLGVSVPAAGVVSILVAVGTVVSSLLSDRVIKRFGTGPVTLFSIAITAVSLLLMGFTRHFVPVLLLALPLGLGAGSVDAALNNFVALHYGPTHMNWLHCFWGVGATLGPMVMSACLVQRNWHGAYRIIAGILFGISLVLVFSLPLWKRAGEGELAQKSREVVPKRELLRLPGAVLQCLAFFLYCSVEHSAGLWASSYFVEAKGLPPDTAASWAAMFFLGITGGRLLSGFLAMRFTDRQLVRTGMLLAFLGSLVLALPLPGAFPLAGLLGIGLGCAPIFPCLIDSTPALFGVKNSQGMVGLQMAAAYSGSTLMAPLFGWVSPYVGMSSWPYYMLGLLLLMFLTSEGAVQAIRKKGRAV